MIVRQMFAEDINRPINGVIKVDQSGEEVIWDEVREYVITRELRKHFMSFFDYYAESFVTPTADMGVWISGFFGSGKSHFLKMLSYILANHVVHGRKTVEWFREKFADDPLTFAKVDASTRGETETILFNIDIEGPINKDKTAVLRVFAKMFYNHLGFYGENLKVAKLEQFIARQGKTEEFRAAFEARNGGTWEEGRAAYAFFQDDIVETLQEVLGMSESAALNWFDSTEETEMSIAQLVSEIRDYVDSKPKNFRLLFMIDEVGQYVGTDTNMLLNLQSLVEKLGSECLGKVWVICTGQEAIDEIIKVRSDEFSRIQARFKTRLSLSSSSVDEVIQKRILRKTPEAAAELDSLYQQNDSVLRNLFSFTDTVLDIKGYSGPTEFVENFPFVPYQFIILQKVYAQIRRHGNSGKHLSQGERSMLSGFQEAAQKVQHLDEYALVPFHRFYDAVHTFLDSSIRRVIERCERAAASHSGIEEQDVDVLKLLYLIRYVEDIKATLDNLVILMADDIRTDKITLRASVQASLDRLMGQNYIARTGECYNFLTDEEQDIQRDIKEEPVDTAAIVGQIGRMIFGDIYTAPKFRYGKYDFAFDRYVDGMVNGVATNSMRLRFLTMATDETEKSKLQLMTQSKGKEAIVVLADTQYFDALQSAMKIRKYVKKKNLSQLPRSVQDIIRNQQDEATRYEETARTELKKAIEGGVFYVDGEFIDIRSGEAKAKIDAALEYLVTHVYSELNLITRNVESEAEIFAILRGEANDALAFGMQHNQGAAAKVLEYLEMQSVKHMPTSMTDVQSRYSGIPYGWRELDIAAVVAKLIFEQQVTIKYSGNTIQPTDSRLVDMLRKRTETVRTSISKRQVISLPKIKQARAFLRDYFDVMDVPEDEDGLVHFIIEKFTAQRAHYAGLIARYENHTYPDRKKIDSALALVDNVLAKAKDNIALVDQLLTKQDDLIDSKEDLTRVESFFATQVDLFDRAVAFLKEMHNDLDDLNQQEEARLNLNRIRLITMVSNDRRFDYKLIPELNGLMDSVRKIHDYMVGEKRRELLDIVLQCSNAVRQMLDDSPEIKQMIVNADERFKQLRERINELNCIALLDGLTQNIWNYKDMTVQQIEAIKRQREAPKPEPVKPTATGGQPVTSAPKPVRKNYKRVHRQALFVPRVLENEEQIDKYVESVREQLKRLLTGFDGVELQ